MTTDPETRALSLVEDIRVAEREGRVWSVGQVAGRCALLIAREDGRDIRFLSPAEEAALRAALEEGPRTLALEGLPICEWFPRRHCFIGRQGTIEVVVETPVTTAPDSLAALPAVARQVFDRMPAILTEVAERLLSTSVGWDGPDSADALAARLAPTTVVLSGDGRYQRRAHLWLDDGGVFGGHAIEVWLDERAGVADASLAG
jgi:hypothetical protein